MNCLQFRQMSVTDPGNHDREYLEHQLSCQPCHYFATDIRKFDEHLKDAVKIPVPDNLKSTILHRRSMLARKGGGIVKQLIPAIAASIIFVTGVTTGVFYRASQTHSGIEQAVVTYVNNHQDIKTATEVISAAHVSELLSPFGIRLTGDIGKVNYAAPCFIRDQLAAHLELQGDYGPIIALFMPDEQLESKQTFRVGRRIGIIVPCPRGSMALIGVFGEQLDNVESNIRKSVMWM